MSNVETNKRRFAEVTDPKRAETIEAVKQGFSIKEVCELVGTEPQRVYQIRHELGMTKPMQNVKRWLKYKNAVAPWVRVEGVRARGGRVLCYRGNGAQQHTPEHNEGYKVATAYKHSEIDKDEIDRGRIEEGQKLVAMVQKWQIKHEQDIVNHPSHYTLGGIETIDYIEAKGLSTNYCLANVIKYVSRCGHKTGTDPLKDLKKAQWYLNREIAKRESNYHKGDKQ